MNTSPFFVGLLASTLSLSALACQVQSAPHRIAFIELYTSEGCSSCPPADQWLGKTVPTVSPEKAVFASFHVTYWDNLGWRDRFADPLYDHRQSWLVSHNGSRTRYTPQVFVSGKTQWNYASPTFSNAIEQINAEPSPIKLTLTLTNKAFTLAWAQTSALKDARLYIAETKTEDSTAVRAGENSGAQLNHHHIVQKFLPAINIDQTQGEQTYPTNTFNLRDDGQIVAFVEDAQGRVVQTVALSKSRCKA